VAVDRAPGRNLGRLVTALARPDGPRPGATTPAPLASRTFPAIGVLAQVVVTEPDALDDATGLVAAELLALDAACSRFRDDSELARLNRSAGRPFAAGPLLRDVLAVALGAAAATGGDVDLTVGGAMRGLGWDRDFALVRSREEPSRIRVVPAAGWRSVKLDRRRGLVTVPPGVELDLGSIAKAHAADRCARLAHEALCTRFPGAGVLVSLGGDVAVAGPAPAGGWSLHITDDHRDGRDAPGPVVSIRDGGLATSSTTVRRWRAAGAERHHIVDPRTGLPAPEVWRTVSVAAVCCAAANAASTSAVVRGEAALPWLEQHRLAARLVRPDGSVVTTSRWPRCTTP
jgi:thiamine biosynthesis lipoprotein